MKAIERFYQYLDNKGIKPAPFEIVSGLSNGYLGTQLKRRGNLGEEILNKIIDNCLDLNPVWLLTGKETMLKTNPYLQNSDINVLNDERAEFLKSKPNETNKQLVPLYDIKALTSAEILFKDENTENSIGQITIPNLPKCDGAIYVSSDSMYPLLKSGDIVLYKKVATTIENIYWGEMYLVSLINDGEDEFVLLKWIYKSEKGDDFITLSSENKHHQSKDIHINAIKGLALIKASIRINSMY
ncbi:helix-turn-helix transcriptional regulator [Flavobacterium sp. N1736]|uniref:S24 family peptidase n=1 Tax=Flavobacterium sp. N1736 TaxID=2986823 RepID=UPI0022240C54|nr:S24 family peptidase [Flavobacterium sp. N1736]